MSLLAGCTNCDFSRRFAPELSGRFYRCPRCREGVIAVPAAAESEASSGSFSLSSSSFEFPKAIERVRANKKKKAQSEETEEFTALDATALDSMAPLDRPSTEVESSAAPVIGGSGPESLDLAGQLLQAEDPTNHRGEVAEARRILVECGLCGFHVRIPVEFFGKTVHCPECAGNTMFTESTLEPVKDELLDRLALETTERDALYRGKERRKLPAWLRNPALRSFLLGVGLGLLVLGVVFGILRLRS